MYGRRFVFQGYDLEASLKEGRRFVVSVGAIHEAMNVPADFPLSEAIKVAGPRFHNGGTCIARPDGRWIVEPVRNEETIVYADLDLSEVHKQRQNFDPTGHYSRPEILRLEINRSRHG